ncbi:BTAD domain-containing putative transcriptional regulator [Actinophytocola sp.]|uniref:BTAD domain-containing putative transcriptional regulator n=1 Tax=Actinophytocola sp. TaxID=1872138 RepID=UPI003D6C2E72
MLASTVRFVGRVVRGLIAAAVLGALVVGLPWALWHYVGWPLPDHVPTWAEVQGVLLGPMTATFLLDVLACLCWITWAAFTIDVGRCTVELARDGVEAARLPNFAVAGPVHALAGVLVGAVVLSVLGNRPPPAPTTSPATALGTGIVATAPAWHDPLHDGEPTVQGAVFATHTSGVFAGGSTAVSAPQRPESVVVRAPENGVHDSLWRIAERTLGDGARWPEIFELNKGKPQPYGHIFTHSSLIFPGQELTLPADATVPPPPPLPRPQDPPPPPAPPEPTPPPPPTTTPPTTTAPPSSPATPAPSTPQEPSTETGANSATREPGFRWGPELFVGLGLAAAVSTALILARRRHNGRYRPGSGDRDELPVAPVVYQLRLAHLRAEQNDTGFDLDDLDDLGDGDHPDFSGSAGSGGSERPRRVPPRVPLPPTLVMGAPETGAETGAGIGSGIDTGERPVLAPGLGVRDGREIALDLATARGLGLVGAGAPAAVRALLVAALTATTGRPAATAQPVGTSMLVPADDLAGLLGRAAAHTPLPAVLRVVPDLDDALDALEAETLVRAAAGREHTRAPGSGPALVLVARPPHQRQRLQAVLDNGAPFGITGLLLGQWQPGVTCYVREDGTISATSPGLGEALRGTQVFRLGDDDTAALLTLLRQADSDTPADDEVALPPTPSPRIAAAEPAAGDDSAGDDYDGDEYDGEVAADTERTNLEVTSTVQPPDPPGAELEILGSARATAPGARLRPPAAPRQQSTAPRTPDTTVPNEASDEVSGEADDDAAHTGEHATTAADPAPVPIMITVLGPLRVYWNPDSDPSATDPDRQDREITGGLQPRTRELLVLLALHPEGIARDALVSALWGQDPPSRPTNALHTALSRMRHTVAAATNGTVTDIAVVGNGRYQLDPTKVTVDYWRFADAVSARRAASTDQARVDAYREVVNSYGGPLAEGMTCEWLEPAREAIRRDAIDAVAALARALVETDPAQTLDLLEVARAFDPHNELLYRDIMRLQDRLGQLDAIPRTLTLLTTRLAEVDETPTPQARGLAARLGQHRDDTSDTFAADTPAAPARLASQGERGRSAAS